MDKAILAKAREAIKQAYDNGKPIDELKAILQQTGYSDEEIADILPEPTAAAPIGEMIKCRKCGFENPKREHFCANCGLSISFTFSTLVPATKQSWSDSLKSQLLKLRQ